MQYLPGGYKIFINKIHKNKKKMVRKVIIIIIIK